MECGVGSECLRGACEVCQPSVFHVPVAHEVGPLSYESNRPPLVTDADGDGHVDVLVTSTGGSSLTLHRGDGTGSLADAVRIETVTRPIAAELTDLDIGIDAYRDLVVAGSGDIMIHNGTAGGFAPGRFTRPPAEGWEGRTFAGLFVGDLVGTALPEMLVLATYAGGTELWLAAGVQGQNFSIPTLLHSSATAFTRLQVTDVNDDGTLDIAVWGKTGDVLWGAPDGTFTAEVGFIPALPRNEVPLRFVELDGDGRPDLLTAEGVGQGTLFYGYKLRSRLWTGASFDLVADDVPPFTGNERIQLEVGDWSGDGTTDLLLREEATSSLVSYSGRGDGTFELGDISLIPAGAGGIATGDLDEDGVADLAALHRDVTAVTTHRGAAPGQFESFVLQLPEATYLRGAAVHLYSDWPTPVVVAIGGLDLDTGRFRVLRYDGASALEEQQQVPIYRPTKLALHDLDEDGHPDALVTTERGLSWFRYEGKGRFASEPELVFNDYPPPRHVAVGDADGDGRVDVFVLQQGSPTGSIRMLSRQSSGARWKEQSQWDVPNGAKMAGADVSGDGLLDLVFSEERNLSVLLGAPGAPPDLAATQTLPEPYYGLELADLDGDGAAEILSGDWRGYTAYRLSSSLELEELDRASAPMLLQTDTFWNVFPARLNDDDFGDLVESEQEGVIALWRGDGSGHFERFERHLVPSSQGPVAVQDMDQDGIDDLLLFGGSQYGGSLLLLKGAFTCKDP